MLFGFRRGKRINGKPAERIRAERMGEKMKQEEKKPIPWEAVDPKPPVVRSGRMENRKNNQNEVM